MSVTSKADVGEFKGGYLWNQMKCKHNQFHSDESMLIYGIFSATYYRNEFFVNEPDIDNKIKITLFLLHCYMYLQFSGY
jgi:hypothetical protein